MRGEFKWRHFVGELILLCVRCCKKERFRVWRESTAGLGLWVVLLARLGSAVLRLKRRSSSPMTPGGGFRIRERVS
jgi:hypothetical protein